MCEVTHEFLWAIVLSPFGRTRRSLFFSMVSFLSIITLLEGKQKQMTAHPASPQIGETYRIRNGKLSLKWFSALASSNGHITICSVFNALYSM